MFPNWTGWKTVKQILAILGTAAAATATANQGTARPGSCCCGHRNGRGRGGNRDRSLSERLRSGGEPAYAR